MELRAPLARHRLLAWTGLAGVAGFACIVVALHALLPRDPWHMSGFANTRYGFWWEVALGCLLAGGAAIVLGLARTTSRRWSKALGVGLLTLAGIGGLLVAIFPMDRGAQAFTTAGAIHNTAAMTTFVILAATMLLMAHPFWTSPGWRKLAIPSILCGLAVAASCAAYMVATFGRLPLAATSQRVLVSFIVAWFALAGIRLATLPAVAPFGAEGLAVAGASPRAPAATPARAAAQPVTASGPATSAAAPASTVRRRVPAFAPIRVLPAPRAAPVSVHVPEGAPARARVGRPPRPRRVPLKERTAPRRGRPAPLVAQHAAAAARRASAKRASRPRVKP